MCVVGSSSRPSPSSTRVEAKHRFLAHSHKAKQAQQGERNPLLDWIYLVQEGEAVASEDGLGANAAESKHSEAAILDKASDQRANEYVIVFWFQGISIIFY